MKVLMISGDPGVLNPNLPAGKRTEEYRNTLGELDVLLCHKSIFSFIFGFLNGCKMMRRKNFDVITAQSPEHWALAWMFSSFFCVPWQMQIHTDIFSPYFVRHSMFNKLRFFLTKFLLSRATSIRVVSERIRKSLVAYGIKPIAIMVLPIFVDAERIKNSLVNTDLRKKYPQFDFIILMASRITKEKNIWLAIEAVSSLIPAGGGQARLPASGGNRRIGLLIVGDGPEKENLKIKVSELELNDNIIFESWAENIISYYKTADIFLLTSNYEGYGMTLIEAASVGAKIISSDVGIAPEILEPENIFKVGDKNDLIAELKNAISGNIKPPKPLHTQTKEEYLRLYKESLEKCLKTYITSR